MVKLLENLSVYSVLLPLFTGLVFWKIQDANARIMVVMLAFASVSQVFGSKSQDHKFLIYNLYSVMDILFWSILMLRNITLKISRVIIQSLFLFFMLYASLLFYRKGINQDFYTDLVSLDLIILVIFVLIYFIEKYKSGKNIELKKEPMFWFCMGELIYAPCTYLLFSTRHFISGKEFNSIWPYHHIFNIILYLLTTIGFLTHVKKIALFKK